MTSFTKPEVHIVFRRGQREELITATGNVCRKLNNNRMPGGLMLGFAMHLVCIDVTTQLVIVKLFFKDDML